MIVTNGMTIPNYSSMSDYEKYFFLGTSQYGQMTAGSFCYIGPQGIVHGSTITLAEAGRKYFGWNDLRGKVYVTAGLGGMSGAQAKAAVINNVIGVCAELSEEALMKRYNQGWLTEYSRDLEEVIASIKKYRAEGVGGVSIGYLGNVVDLWERLAEEDELLVELGSDQTSCHLCYGGGYWPAGLTFKESSELLSTDPDEFKKRVDDSLRRHIAAVNKLSARG